MSVEREMSELTQQAEKNLFESGPTASLFAHLSEKEVIEAANNNQSALYQSVSRKYPNILDRELLVGSLEQKYTHEDSNLNQEINNLYKNNESAIEQGHPPQKLQEMKKQIQIYGKIVSFLSEMNDTEYNLMSKKWEKEAKEEKAEKTKEKETKEALEIFMNHKFQVPASNSPEGYIEITLSEYLNKITTMIESAEYSNEEVNTRLNHLKENFNSVIKSDSGVYICEHFLKTRMAIKEKWIAKKRENELYEPTLENLEEQKKLETKLINAGIKVILLNNIVNDESIYSF